MTDQFEGDLLRPHGHPAHASRTARPRRGTQCRAHLSGQRRKQLCHRYHSARRRRHSSHL